jgi:hypothetical protein
MPEPAGQAELRAIYCFGRTWHLCQFVPGTNAERHLASRLEIRLC